VVRAGGGQVTEVDAPASANGMTPDGPLASPEPRSSVAPAWTRWRRLMSWVRRPTTLGAVAVAAVAVLLRAGAIDFALPVLTHPDEPVTVRFGAAMSDRSDWNPHFFNYPSMLYDVIAVFTRVHDWLAGPPAEGVARIHTQNVGIAATSEPDLFLALRSFTLLLSVAMCMLAYYVVLRATRRGLAALLAGLLLALSPVALTSGVLITPDTYSGVFSALALLGAVAVVRNGRRLDYVIAGAGVGLAAGAKYNAAVVVVAVIAAHVIRHRASWWRRPEIMLSGVAAGVFFVLVTPAAVLDSSDFVAGALREARHYARGHPGFDGGGSFWYYLRALRPEWLLLAGGCLSVLCLRSRHRREVAVLLVFAVAYGALISFQDVHFARNVLPVLPALAMLAGFTAAVVIDQLVRLPRPGNRVLAAGAGVVVVAGLVVATMTAARVPQRLEERPRLEALRWLNAHIPAGSRVVVESYGPYIPPGRYEVRSIRFITKRPQVPSDTAAIVVTEFGSGRFLSQPQRYHNQVAEYRVLRSRYCLAARWTDGPWVEVLTPCDRRQR
jgi:Dolichyl-phosphate-mannose-protein mannosyltransferase